TRTASPRPSAATNSSRLRPASASWSLAAPGGRSPSAGGSAADGNGSGWFSATFSATFSVAFAATSDGSTSARGAQGASGTTTTGAGEGVAGGTAAEGRAPPVSTTDTSRKAKSWSTRSLNVISQPVWSSSSGAGSSSSPRRRSGRALRKLRETAPSFGGGGPHIRAQQALDSRGVLPPVHEQDT